MGLLRCPLQILRFFLIIILFSKIEILLYKTLAVQVNLRHVNFYKDCLQESEGSGGVFLRLRIEVWMYILPKTFPGLFPLTSESKLLPKKKICFILGKG